MEQGLGSEDCPACGGKACVQVFTVRMAIDEGPVPPGEVQRFCSNSDCPTRVQPS